MSVPDRDCWLFVSLLDRPESTRLQFLRPSPSQNDPMWARSATKSNCQSPARTRRHSKQETSAWRRWMLCPANSPMVWLRVAVKPRLHPVRKDRGSDPRLPCLTPNAHATRWLDRLSAHSPSGQQAVDRLVPGNSLDFRRLVRNGRIGENVSFRVVTALLNAADQTLASPVKSLPDRIGFPPGRFG